jgi:hypothetical protein
MPRLQGIVLRQVDLVELLLAQLVVVAQYVHHEDTCDKLNNWTSAQTEWVLTGTCKHQKH